MSALQGVALLLCFGSGVMIIGILMICVFMPFVLWFNDDVEIRKGAIAGTSSILLLSLGIGALSLPIAAGTDTPIGNARLEFWLVSALLLSGGSVLLRKAMKT